MRQVLTAVLFMLVLAPCARAGEAGPAESALGVRQLMKNVEKYPGSVRVDGVVSQVFPDQSMLALIDLAEFKECKVVTCAQLSLPVRWDGPMPAVATVVRVDGRVRKQGARRVFVADKLRSVD